MLRRGLVGRSGIQRQLEAQEHYRQIGKTLSQSEIQHANEQLQLFHEKLEEFARKHSAEIRSDPVFRHQFQRMCTQIGVDPLASSKGFWSELLGVGDFYYELAIQIITICIASREQYGNGGLLDMETLQKRLQKLRKTEINEDDITRAVKSIQVLGNGYRIIQLGQKQFVQSVPMELSTDHISIMSFARQLDGRISINDVMNQFHWTEEHSLHVLNHLLGEGILWIDKQSRPHHTYWVMLQ